MKRIAVLSMFFGLLLLTIAGCGDEEAITPEIVPTSLPVIDPANFVDSDNIDNQYFPLKPGTTRIFDGMDEDDTVRIEEFVTHETKQILGVTCVVVRVKPESTEGHGWTA